MQRLLPILLLLPLSGCLHVKVDPVKVDATITLRVERELDDYFSAIDSASETVKADSAETSKNSSSNAQ